MEVRCGQPWKWRQGLSALASPSLAFLSPVYTWSSSPPTQIGVGGTEARHSQHPSVQLPPHDHPKGLLQELHAVECERRLAIDTRGLQGHFIASVGRIFDLKDKNSVMRPLVAGRP